MSERRKQKPVPLSEVFLKGVLVHNPVLVQLIGICPVAAAAVSLRTGALLAAVSSLIIIATHVAASAFLKKIVRWVRVAVYLLIGLAIIAPVSWLLETYYAELRLTIGIYLPLLAVNSLIALRCEKVAVRNSVKNSFIDSIAVSIGYSIVLLITGFIRELLGKGEFLEKPVQFLPAASGLLLPFGGFLVLGFMAAALKTFVMRRYPKYAKAMSVEILSTAVTMKLKPEDDALSTQPEPDIEPAPLPAPAAAATNPADNEESADEADAGEKTPDDSGTAEPAADEPAEEEPVAQTAETAEYEDDTDPLPAEPEPAAGAQEDAPMPAAPPEKAAPLTAPADSGIPDTDSFDLKLKELFAYLDELEKETKAEQKE